MKMNFRNTLNISQFIFPNYQLSVDYDCKRVQKVNPEEIIAHTTGDATSNYNRLAHEAVGLQIKFSCTLSDRMISGHLTFFTHRQIMWSSSNIHFYRRYHTQNTQHHIGY
jgi:hypothetical protein